MLEDNKMKIIINDCYGGFGISNLALKEYYKQKGIELFFYKQTKYHFMDGQDLFVKISENENVSNMTYAVSIDCGDSTDNISDKENFSFNTERTDPILISIVEELGEKANAVYAKLKVIEIPDGIEYEIDEYDGVESIHEKHRSWG